MGSLSALLGNSATFFGNIVHDTFFRIRGYIFACEYLQDFLSPVVFCQPFLSNGDSARLSECAEGVLRECLGYLRQCLHGFLGVSLRPATTLRLHLASSCAKKIRGTLVFVPNTIAGRSAAKAFEQRGRNRVPKKIVWSLYSV